VASPERENLGRRHARRSLRAIVVIGGLALASPSASGGALAETPQVRLELNKLEDLKDGCRVYLVFENATPVSYEGYKLDFVMFGRDGVIARRLAVEASPLKAQKTTVKLFDVGGLACTDLGAILVNDVLACHANGQERADCISSLATASRTAVSLKK
jgi:hypothetical protein